MDDAVPHARPSLIRQNAPRIARRRRWRMFYDTLARYGVSIGGVSVIAVISLIFFYFLYVVLPLFAPASVYPVSAYPLPGGADQATLHLALEEQAEIALRASADGRLTFFRADTGQVVDEHRVTLPANASITSFAHGAPHTAVLALGLSDGRAVVVRHRYRVSYPDNRRTITPEVEYPLGNEPLVVDPAGRPLVQLSVQSGEERTTLAGATGDRRVLLAAFTRQSSFLDETVSVERSGTELPYPATDVVRLLLDQDQRRLSIATRAGNLSRFDISRPEAPELIQHLPIVAGGARLTAVEFLAGTVSLLVGSSDGRIVQWFPVRDEAGREVLTRIRAFKPLPDAVALIAPEHSRKGFVAVDEAGRAGVYHSTANRRVLLTALGDAPVHELAVSPRANALLAADADGRLRYYHVHNEHPEISWSALWGKVWYEGYSRPYYIWQSSSASDIFEPKFSLMPLSFGTLKAAFYAMLIAIPLAIMGAIFTAHFMSARMRALVKPSVEIMEALPTVILGFLAGLWLAPIIEDYLPGIVALLLILPPGVLLAAYAWQHLPGRIRHRVPEGWEAALLIPVVLLIGYLALGLSPLLELWLFGGDVRLWLTSELGVDFDQRNAIVVGVAMGFAVIPTIFSIAEDAIFAVPKHLVNGSLALGATAWQTMLRVVLLTASPGIFSAVMIGLGRAVGETMIVLMATGNTPVMDLSLFQGMRTLSANIAVEMPESEVNSTHYRVLFLAALVLFGFTFLVNTVAEIVRQRLRRRYSRL